MDNTFKETQTITSQEKIKEIFTEYFVDKTAYVNYSGRDIRVKCYSYANGKAMIGIPFISFIPDPVIIHTLIGNKQIHLYLKKTGRAGVDISLFDFIECRIIVPARSSDRFNLSYGKDYKKVVFITGFITDTLVENTLLYESRKIRNIFAQAELELLKYFSAVKFLAKAEAPADVRMQYISIKKKGIIIRNFEDKQPEDEEGYEFYIKNIFPKEKPVKNSQPVVSEAVLPLYYKNKILYGYLKVNKKSEMSDSDLTLAKNFVSSIEKYLIKLEIFPVVNEKIIVQEVSAAGLSVLQRDKKNIRHFKIGSQFCFDLVFPENKKVNLLARLRHNSPGRNGIIHTGFEIEKIDCDNLTDYKNYLGSFDQQQQQAV